MADTNSARYGNSSCFQPSCNNTSAHIYIYIYIYSIHTYLHALSICCTKAYPKHMNTTINALFWFVCRYTRCAHPAHERQAQRDLTQGPVPIVTDVHDK